MRDLIRFFGRALGFSARCTAGLAAGALLHAVGAGAQTADELTAELLKIDRLVVGNQIDAAVSLGEDLLERVERNHGGDSREAARVLAVIALAHCVGRREIDLGIELASRASEIAARPRAGDDASFDSRPMLRALGWCYRQAGRYQDARATLARAITASKSSAADEGASMSEPSASSEPDVDGLEARLRVELATIEHDLGNLREARTLLEESLRMAEAASSPSTQLIGASRNALGVVTWRLGDLDAAAGHFEQLLEDASRNLGPDHAQIASFSNNYGLVLQDLGRWIEARRQYERAVAIARARDYPSQAAYLNNLGNLAQDLGDWRAGEEAYRRSLEIEEEAIGPDHPNLARTLTNLGNLLRVTGRLDEAERQYRRALDIRERTLGSDHLDVAYTVINLGHLERRRRRWTQADELYRRALAIRTQALGERAPIVAQTIHERARLRLLEGRFEEAIADFRRALEIREQALGPDHHAVAKTLADLAIAATAAGDEGLAIASASRAEEIGRQHYRLTARQLTEREGLGLSSHRVGGRDLLLSLAVGAGRGRLVERSFEAVLRARNVVLEELSIRQEALRDATPALESSFSELQKASARLARLMATSSAEGDDRGGEIERAAALVDRLEREVAEGSETLRRSRELPSLDQVLAGLPAETALVSLVRYRDFIAGPLSEGEGEGLTAPPAYVALVAAGEGVRAVGLGAARTIDLAVEQWRRQIRAPATGSASEEDYRRAATSLRRVLWDPIAGSLGSADRVLVVPDGDLHLVNLATLPAEDGRYLAESGPLFHTLVAETDLLRAPSANRGGGLLAVGDPDFESAEIGAAGLLSQPDRRAPEAGSEAVAASPAVQGELRRWCPSITETRFAAIPGTGDEARVVERLWRSSHDRAGAIDDAGSSRLLTGAAASESAVKSLASGRRIVHLATHGFSVGPDCQVAGSGVRGVGGLAPASRERFGRILSGLVLAGAHQALEDPGARGEDGLLTSLEIGGLDLRSAEWVVLSACDMGVGPSVAGEGVLAMHRAFLAAGARTVITSLWPVEDSSAREWMEHLYRARLSEGLSTAEAVRAATLRSLTQRRAREAQTHPFYWGAFLAVGDWR